MGRALPASIALLATVPVLPAPASAYRTASELADYRQEHDPYPVRWRGRRLTVSVGPTDASGLPRAVVEAALDASVEAWREATCGTLTIDVVRSRPTRARTGDGRVTVEWRDDDWASAGLSAQAAGTTDVVYQQATSGDWGSAPGGAWRPTTCSERTRAPTRARESRPIVEEDGAPRRIALFGGFDAGKRCRLCQLRKGVPCATFGRQSTFKTGDGIGYVVSSSSARFLHQSA